jgi:hypothetical protein
MATLRTYRAGSAIEDYCRACKTDRMHTVVAADAAGRPIRVLCGYCRSEHNYRGGPRVETSERERSTPPVMSNASEDLEMLLRRIIREESGLTPAAPAAKWRGGALVLKPGAPGLQEKSWPIETFFHKIVMLRNRLRTLEQQINASDLPDDVKVKVQSYISGCYGSLTSFNVLFADEGDQFKGSSDA